MGRRRRKIFLILVVAAFLRLYRLGSVPPALTWDEASLGYNAWSVALTGRDEHGKFLPHDAFAAFGDYKPPVYVYAAAPFLRLLGPTVWAVRLPSALAGIAAVFLTYVFTRNLFASFGAWGEEQAEKIALVASFLLAVSPWSLQFSRAAIEANFAQTLVISGATFLILSIKRPWLMPPAAVFFVLSFYTFNSVRVFTPLLLLGFLAIFARVWRERLKWVFVSSLIGSLLLFPLVPFLRSPLARVRFQEVNIFSDLSIVLRANERIERDGGAWWARLIHNRRLGYAASFLDHYFDHFSGKFLFARGDVNPKLSVRKMGELYLAELPFLIWGVYILWKRRCRASALIFFWLLAAPIPAATARETPHALRSLTFLPSFQIVSAVGVVKAWRQRRRFLYAALVLFLVQAGLYFDYYYRFYGREFSRDWEYGYRPLVKEVLGRAGAYERVVVSHTYGRPYIFFLFYGRMRPEEFWEKGVVETDVFGFKTVKKIGKFEFGQIDYQADSKPGTLMAGAPRDFPAGVRPERVIEFLDGEPAFWLVEGGREK